MSNRIHPILVLLTAVAFLAGCGVGYNSLLFTTKTNIGLDVDTKPPTAEVAISRTEGVIEPTFEGGKTLPVLSSLRAQGQGFFAGNVGQTFVTGDAAVAMAELYDSTAPGTKPEIDSALPLENAPKLPGSYKLVSKETEVRPVFFGTSTSFGLKTTWSGTTAAYPDSLHIGYKRKEFALAPIGLEGNGDAKTPYKVRAPSLLATIDAGGKVGGISNSELQWLQYFATGKAATAMAMQSDVRKAMLYRLDPNKDKIVTTVATNQEAGALEARKTLSDLLNDDNNIKKFKTWLKNEKNYTGSPTLWITAASKSELEEATQHIKQ